MRIELRARKKTLFAAVVVALLVVAAAAAGPLGVHVTSQTNSKVKVAWTADPQALGYVMVRDGVRVSNTWDANVSSTTFSKPDSASHVYGVIPIYPTAGEYVTVGTTQPPPPPPPPPGGQRFDTTAPAGTTGLPRALTECMASIVRDTYNPNGNTTYNVPRDDLATGWTDSRFSWWSGFPKWISRRNQIDDHYTYANGTQPSTTEIFSAGACRWGIREDLLRAVAVQESDWHEHTTGSAGWGDRCSGHPNGDDGFGSYGIMQVKNFNCAGEGDWGGFPRSWYSTPFNVDLYGAAFRACLEQSFWYTIPTGDSPDRRERGCVGAWFSGSYNPDSSYTNSVYGHLSTKDWTRY